jgi:sporulation protein YlmC with PRC-barrel domain
MLPSDVVKRPSATRRIQDLLGAQVRSTAGRELGHVNDVRLVRGDQADPTSRLVVDGLVVADRHAGSLLGYDRKPDQGPVLLRLLVRALHRNAGLAPWRSVRQVDWESKVIVVDLTELQHLSGV